jgi:NTE family protein
VFINATDIRYGERFEFSQDQFDPLCSDLEPFPLSRAVAASMAVPLLFSPVTLWNHR